MKPALALAAGLIFFNLIANAADTASVPPFTPMPVGAVKPQGWMRAQLAADLHEGILGAYDRISDNVSSDLFAAQSRQPGTKVLGNRGLQEKAWWAGEHEGYWMGALVRAAILTDDKPTQERVRAWVEKILAAAQKTGYIGIYSEQTRFPAKGFDGELWTQSRAFEALLAWYQFSGDERVLKAVEQSVHKTMDRYRQSTYFGREKIDGGGTHGVGYMDTIEWLYRLTHDRYYAEAATWLYSDYSAYETPFTDLHLKKMTNANVLWQDHTPHVAEALAMPGICYFLTGDAKYKTAAENVPVKLARHTNPGGGFTAGKLEAIAGVLGGGNEGGEYCAMTEGIGSLNKIFAYEGNVFSADWSERCALNAAQGARFHPANRGVIYISRDNRTSADNPKAQAGRELFSASHTAAACCALTSMRLLPNYIEGMWFQSSQRAELWMRLYGPSTLTTTVNGVKISVEQVTDYPFSDSVVLKVNPEKPIAIDFVLRVPPNCGEPDVKACSGATVRREGRYLRVSKTWKAGDEIAVNFKFQIARQTQLDGKEACYQWGALVFARAFPAKEEVLKNITSVSGKVSGFSEYLLRPESTDGDDWRIDPDARFEKVSLPAKQSDPWVSPTVGLKGKFLDASGKSIEATLVPLGSTLLRRTTFPLTADAAKAGAKKQTIMDTAQDPMRKY